MKAPFDIDKIFFSVARIKERVRELGEAISKDYEGKDPVLCLRGAAMCGPDALHLDYFGLDGYLDLHRRAQFRGCAKSSKSWKKTSKAKRSSFEDIVATRLTVVPESCH